MAEKTKAAAKKKAEQADAVDPITEEKDGTFTYLCPLNVFGKLAPGPACGFTSKGHPTEESATLRETEHVEEHESGEPMREIVDFITDNKIEV